MALQGISEKTATQQGLMQSEICQQAGIPRSQLAFHETMEIHELLNFKTVCILQSKLMSGLVFDQNLKTLLEKDVQQSGIAIRELQGLYQAAPQLRQQDVTR